MKYPPSKSKEYSCGGLFGVVQESTLCSQKALRLQTRDPPGWFPLSVPFSGPNMVPSFDTRHSPNGGPSNWWLTLLLTYAVFPAGARSLALAKAFIEHVHELRLLAPLWIFKTTDPILPYF